MTNINILGVYSSEPSSFINTDTLLFFDNRVGGLSKTDGTVEGTFQLVNFEEDFSNGSFALGTGNSATIGNNLFFLGSEDEFGAEPWISNGTVEGTRVLKDINPNGSSNPSNFIPLNDSFLFAADDGVNGQALWKSDGTEAGTELVKVFREGAEAAFNGLVLEDTANVLGDSLYFTFTGFEDDDRIGLWKSDGTPEGTQLFAENLLAGSLTTVDDQLFFVNFSDSEEFTGQAADAELWITDGTEEGTRLVEDIFPTPEDFAVPQSSLPQNLTDVNGTLFFTADNGVNGRELWISDGTAEGTNLVKDIRPEEIFSGTAVNLGSEPENLINVNGTLFFTADDGVNGRELWKSDGTAEGTQLVKVIAETDESTGGTDLFASQFVNVDGILYFLALGGLWRSDGTEAGTFIVDTELETFIFEPEEQVLRDVVTNNEYTGFGITSISEFNDRLFLTGRNSNQAQFQTFSLASLSDDENPVEGENSVGSTVYRFFNPDAGVHFYTANPEERDAVQNLDNYNFEGESYQTVDPLANDAEEVYRFFNSQTGVHLYTTSEDERDNIQANLEQFTFEGTSFYAYETQVEGSIPIYRFFEPTIGVHFYTPNEAERAFVEESLENYNSEGVAYYAFPLAENI